MKPGWTGDADVPMTAGGVGKLPPEGFAELTGAVALSLCLSVSSVIVFERPSSPGVEGCEGGTEPLPLDPSASEPEGDFSVSAKRRASSSAAWE